MYEIPFIDWNDNGRIDGRDIALTLAMKAASHEDEEEEDELSGPGE